MKVKVTKQNAMNEILEIDCDIKSPSEWEDKIRPVLRELDKRQFELNLRVLTVNKQIGKLNPTEYAHLQDILAGLNNIIVEKPEEPEVPAELIEHLDDEPVVEEPDGDSN